MRVKVSIARSWREYADVFVEAPDVEIGAAYVQALMESGEIGEDGVERLGVAVPCRLVLDRAVIDEEASFVGMDGAPADVTVPEGWEPPMTMEHDPTSHAINMDDEDAAARGGKDSAALLAIHALLDGKEWDADTLDAIAEIVRGSGREVRDCGTEEDADNCPDCGRFAGSSPDCEACKQTRLDRLP